MYHPFFERDIFRLSRCRTEEGVVHTRLFVFGKMVYTTTPEPLPFPYFGMTLSLSKFVIITCKPDMELPKFNNFPICKRFLGSIKTEEVVDETYTYDTRLDGHDYRIQRLTRFSYYEKWPKYPLKKSAMVVYQVSSPTDPDLPDYSFAPPEWEGLDPAPYDVVYKARQIRKLALDFQEN